jgi:hypothetical protein
MDGFPNLFMVCGPNGPSALANIITLNQQNVDWICSAITHMRDNGLTAMEPRPDAEEAWMDIVATLADKTLVSKANTWYVGANIEGKTKGLTMYTGGFANYRNSCADAQTNGYREFTFAPRKPDLKVG